MEIDVSEEKLKATAKAIRSWVFPDAKNLKQAFEEDEMTFKPDNIYDYVLQCWGDGLNNFPANYFPYSFHEGICRARQQITYAEWLDLTPIQVHQQHVEKGEKWFSLSCHSELYKSQTGGEFLDTVERVVAHYNIDPEEIWNNYLYPTDYRKVSRATEWKTTKKIYQVLVHLVALGYEKYELTV